MTTATITKKEIGKKVKKDISVLASFIGAYCKVKHVDREHAKYQNERYLPKGGPTLCEECSKLLSYAIGKRVACPYDPKPACRKCKTHCYRGDYREKMKEVMRFSGPYLIKRGRLDLLLHYLQ